MEPAGARQVWKDSVCGIGDGASVSSENMDFRADEEMLARASGNPNHLTPASPRSCGSRRRAGDFRCVCIGTTRRFFSRRVRISPVGGRCLCGSHRRTAGGRNVRRSTTNGCRLRLQGPAVLYRRYGVSQPWARPCTLPRLNARRKPAKPRDRLRVGWLRCFPARRGGRS